MKSRNPKPKECRWAVARGYACRRLADPVDRAWFSELPARAHRRVRELFLCLASFRHLARARGHGAAHQLELVWLVAELGAKRRGIRILGTLAV